VLACGPGAALSHASALTLWGIETHWSTPLEVIVPRDRRPKGIRTHRPARIHRREITTHLAIRTTTLARTILDLAARLPDKRRRRTVHNSLHSKYMTNSQLAEVLQRNPTHPGTRLLTPFLAETNTGITRSEIEHTFTQLGADYDFPRFLTNVTLPNGYTADVPRPRPDRRARQLELHSDRISFQDDRDRDAENLAIGTPTLRVTHERMKQNPAREAHRVLSALNWLEQRKRRAR
jgi:hypothetical protein